VANIADSTVTFFALDPAVLVAVRDQVRPAVPWSPAHVLSLEAAVPTGLDLDDWDHERAFAAWGTSRPEVDSELLEEHADRLVYRVGTAWSGPETVWATLSAQHPGLVVHSVSSDGSEFSSCGWYVAGRAVRWEEGEPDVQDDGDEEVRHPAEWAFSESVAREVLADSGPVS
jgi:hypothetical protein